MPRLLAALALLAAPALAQETHGERLARSDYARSIIEQMTSPEGILAVTPEGMVPASMRRRLAEIVAEEMDRLRPEMMDALAVAAARNFTPEEVAALLAFYDSPVGRSVLAKTQPFLMDVNRRMGPALADVQMRVMRRMMSGGLQ
jgi:hypothetical protein